jgi:hypothetical protein
MKILVNYATICLAEKSVHGELVHALDARDASPRVESLDNQLIANSSHNSFLESHGVEIRFRQQAPRAENFQLELAFLFSNAEFVRLFGYSARSLVSRRSLAPNKKAAIQATGSIPCSRVHVFPPNTC